MLVVAPIHAHLASTAAALWLNSAVDLKRQLPVPIPMTYLPAISPGIVMEGVELWRPQGESECERTFDITVHGHEEASPLTGLPQAALELGALYYKLKNVTGVNVVAGDGTTVFVPSFELFRFYIAAGSSAFSTAILTGAERTFGTRDDLGLFLDLSRSGKDEQGVFHAALRPRVPRQSAYVLGRLHESEVALRQVANIVLGFRTAQPNSVAAATSMTFPFEGDTRLRVVGISYQRPDGQRTFLVQRILSCTHPFPFASVRVHLAYTALKRTHVDLSPPPDPVRVPPADRSRPRAPRSTQWVNPPARQPHRHFDAESVETMFPDLVNKPITVTPPAPGAPVPRRRGKPGNDQGGYGPGLPGGEGIPVEVKPQDKETEKIVDQAAPEHLSVLNAAVALLREGKFGVTSCLASHPGGVIDLADPEKEGNDWTYVYDAVLGRVRPRTAQMVRLERAYPTEDGSLDLRVGYVFEIESLESVLLYFENVGRTDVSEEDLERIVSECRRLQGSWRSRISLRGNGKKPFRLVLKGDLPDLRFRPEEHRWDGASGLVAKLRALHGQSWDAIVTEQTLRSEGQPVATGLGLEQAQPANTSM